MEKVKKNFYLPAWIADLVDIEGENYGGPGVVAAAAICHFCNQDDSEKVRILQDYRAKEIDMAYQISNEGGNAAAARRAVARTASDVKASHKKSQKQNDARAG